MEYNFTEGSLNPVIQRIVSEMQGQAQDKNLTIKLPAADIVAKQVFDQIRLEQVIRNLLSNAVKFSESNGVIEIESVVEGGRTVVSMKDCGPGIPVDEVEYIFDKFAQSTATRDGSGGTGLGLPLCREIIAAHQGKIYALNNDGNGATFVFEIPNDLAVSNSGFETELLTKQA